MNDQMFPKPIKEKKRVKPQKFSSKVAKDIKERDGCCIICRSESQLTAHHTFWRSHERIYDDTKNSVERGVTLCFQDHRELHDGNNFYDELCHFYLSELYK